MPSTTRSPILSDPRPAVRGIPKSWESPYFIFPANDARLSALQADLDRATTEWICALAHLGDGEARGVEACIRDLQKVIADHG